MSREDVRVESDLFCIEILGHKEDFRGLMDFQHMAMYQFIRHRGLEKDFQDYFRSRGIMDRDIKYDISNGLWKLKRNAELKTLFNELKNADDDMVDDIINNIHKTMKNRDYEKGYEMIN